MMMMPAMNFTPREVSCLRAVAVLLLWGCVALPLAAGETAKPKVQLPGPADASPAVKNAKPQVRKPADFKSAHFLLHTDLPPKKAQELLRRLEVMLKLISTYWGHPPLGTIECYVVEDLAYWPEGSLAHSGRAKIQEGAGVTLVETLDRGDKIVAAKAVVYATSERGTPQHEAVHAYCGQTFGKTGPLWYSEGMAEMGKYWRPGDASVHCSDYVVRYIHSVPAKPLSEILAEDGIPRPGQRGAVSGDSWQNYAWRWALCHLLENNPNYSARFRALGSSFLTGRHVSFADAYGAMQNEIAFEYRFFLRHLDQGYRVDLCSWDWKRKFNEPSGDSPKVARVAANRGWQASGVTVSSDKRYDYSASGVWQTSKGGPEMTAGGQSDGAGRLEGVVFKDFNLSEPFALSDYGSFTPPSDGRLYLRCRDAWNELADNKGAMTVKIKFSGQGQKLPRPGRKSEEAAEEPVETTAKAD